MFSFQSNTEFKESLKNGFINFLNKQLENIQVSYILSLYVDNYLRWESYLTVSKNIEETFTNIVSILSYLNEKDKFYEMDENYLNKRLQSQDKETYVRIDAEKQLMEILEKEEVTRVDIMKEMLSDYSKSNKKEECDSTYEN